jgi:Domain of unknown function (DUF4189)
VKRAGVLLAACALGGAAAHAQTVVPRPLPARPIVVVPGTVTPVTPVPVENWGAIAYHRATGAFGYSFDYASPRDAGTAALEACVHPECTVVASYRNACGALVDGPTGPAFAEGVTAQEAETKARLRCTDPQCHVIAWSCTK